MTTLVICTRKKVTSEGVLAGNVLWLVSHVKISQLFILVSLRTAFLICVTSKPSGVILINNKARELSEQETPKVITALYQMEISLEEASKGILFNFSKLEQAKSPKKNKSSKPIQMILTFIHTSS